MGRGRKDARSPGRWRTALAITAGAVAIAVLLLILGGRVSFRDWPPPPSEDGGVAERDANRGAQPRRRVAAAPLVSPDAPRLTIPESGGAPPDGDRPKAAPRRRRGYTGPGGGTTPPPKLDPVRPPPAAPAPVRPKKPRPVSRKPARPPKSHPHAARAGKKKTKGPRPKRAASRGRGHPHR